MEEGGPIKKALLPLIRLFNGFVFGEALSRCVNTRNVWIIMKHNRIHQRILWPYTMKRSCGQITFTVLGKPWGKKSLLSPFLESAEPLLVEGASK